MKLDDLFNHPQFQQMPSERKLAATRGYYRKFVKSTSPHIAENDFVDSLKPQIYGKAGIGEHFTTGLLESMAGTVAPISAGIDYLVGRKPKSLADVTRDIVGEERQYRVSDTGMVPSLARGVGYLAGDLPLYMGAGAAVKGITKIPALVKAGKAVSKVTKLPKAFIPELAHQAATFGGVSGYKGAAEGVEGVKKGIIEGVEMAVPFTGAQLLKSRIGRALATSGIGGGMAVVAGGGQQEIINNTILMGVLGLLSKRLQDAVVKDKVTDKGLDNAIKQQTGKTTDELIIDLVDEQKALPRGALVTGEGVEIEPTGQIGLFDESQIQKGIPNVARLIANISKLEGKEIPVDISPKQLEMYQVKYAEQLKQMEAVRKVKGFEIEGQPIEGQPLTKEIQGYHYTNKQGAESILRGGIKISKIGKQGEFPDPANGFWITKEKQSFPLPEGLKEISIKGELNPKHFETVTDLYNYINSIIGKNIEPQYLGDVDPKHPLFNKDIRQKVTNKILAEGYDSISFGKGFEGYAHTPNDILVLDIKNIRLEGQGVEIPKRVTAIQESLPAFKDEFNKYYDIKGKEVIYNEQTGKWATAKVEKEPIEKPTPISKRQMEIDFNKKEEVTYKNAQDIIGKLYEVEGIPEEGRNINFLLNDAKQDLSHSILNFGPSAENVLDNMLRVSRDVGSAWKKKAGITGDEFLAAKLRIFKSANPVEYNHLLNQLYGDRSIIDNFIEKTLGKKPVIKAIKEFPERNLEKPEVIESIKAEEELLDKRLYKPEPKVSGKRAYDFSPEELTAYQAERVGTATPEQVKLIEGREARIEDVVAKEMGRKWLEGKLKGEPELVKPTTKLTKEFIEDRKTRLLQKENQLTETEKVTTAQEQIANQHNPEEIRLAKNQLNENIKKGIPYDDPVNKPLLDIITKKVSSAGEPDKPFYDHVDTNKLKVKELTEAQELAALTTGEEGKVELGLLGADKIANAIRTGVDVGNNLIKLSERIVIDGIKTFKDFVYKMKEYLGDMFGKFANQMSKLFSQANRALESTRKWLIPGEGTTLGFFIGEGFGKRGGVDKSLIKKMGKGEELLKHENVELKGDRYKDIGRVKLNLEDVLRADDLLNKAYGYDPAVLKKIPVNKSLYNDSQYNPDTKSMDINTNQPSDQILLDLKHETQHAIDDYHGRPIGSSPDTELIGIVYNVFKKLEGALADDTEFLHDREVVNRIFKNEKVVEPIPGEIYKQTMINHIENILNKYTDLKEVLKEIYPKYQGESLREFAFEKYRGVRGEAKARVVESLGYRTLEEQSQITEADIINEAGRYPSKRAAIEGKALNIALDNESKINEKNIYDVTKPFIDATVHKGTNVLEWLNHGIRTALRVPLWHKEISRVNKFLHNEIERRSVEVTNFARRSMEEFFRLPKDVKEKLGKDMWQWDIEEVIKTPAELQALGYTPEMIKAYRGVRNGLDYIHDSFMKSELVKLFTNKMTNTEMKKIINGYDSMTEDMQLKMRRAVAVTKADAIIDKSKITGYLPRYRFGRYVVHVKDETGTILNKGFENIKEANNFTKSIGDKARVIDTKYEKVDALEMMTIERYIPLIKRVMKEAGMEDADIGEVTGILNDKWLDVFASGKLSKREGIPGYDTDLERALLTYTENFPKSILKRFKQPDLKELIKSIPTEGGQREYANNLTDFFYGRTDKEGKINRAVRSYMYLNYLVMKPAFAVLNLTGRVTMTAPWTINEVAKLKPGMSFMDATKEGWRYILDAQGKEVNIIKDLVNGISSSKHLPDIIKEANYLNVKEKSVLLHLYRQGEFRAVRQLEIGGTEYEKWLGRIDIMGKMSERSNRIHAALVATNLYSDLGYAGALGGRVSTRMKGLIDAVDQFVNITQIMYSKANRPEIARGWKAPIMVFKNFMLGYLNMYYSMLGEKNKAAFVNGMATTMALGGVAGAIPARDEINKVIDYFMETVVNDPSWPVVRKQYENMLAKPAVGKALMYGLPSLLGIDASGMVGFPNITGSAVLPTIQGAIELPKNIFRPDMTTTEKVKVFIPSQAKHLYNLYKITKFGVPTDRTGKFLIYPKDVVGLPYNTQQVALRMFSELPKEMSFSDKVAMAFGFPTIAVNKYYDDVHAIKSSKELTRIKKAQIHRSIAKAIIAQDKEEVDSLFEQAVKKGIKLDNEAIVGHITAYEAQ